MKKKPNYKLRRRVAKIIVVVIILGIIVLLNLNKIKRIPIYFEYFDNRNMVSAFFDVGYTNEETLDIMKELKDTDKLDDLNENYIIELNDKGYLTNKNQMFYIEELKEFYNKVKAELEKRKTNK